MHRPEPGSSGRDGGAGNLGLGADQRDLRCGRKTVAQTSGRRGVTQDHLIHCEYYSAGSDQKDAFKSLFKKASMQTRKIPVTVITGFPGAGKTSLVNLLLAQNPDWVIGVIVNEFGKVGIDGELIAAGAGPVIEIRNSCVCCTVRTDLNIGIKSLLARTDIRLDRLIVETSGLADPTPMLQAILAD